MLKGQALIAQIDDIRNDVANAARVIPQSEIVLACGYVKENGKPNFIAFYEELLEAKGIIVNDEDEIDEEDDSLYAELSRTHGRDAVDAYVEVFGEDYLNYFEDAYQGEYESGADFARQLVEDCYTSRLPHFVEIDWEATWQNLSYDYCEQDGFIFSNNW